jgi:hypothetical protein
MAKKIQKIKKKFKKSTIAHDVTVVCEMHPDYKAVYPPKEDCIVCWKIYASRMHLMVKLLKITLKELKNAQR